MPKLHCHLRAPSVDQRDSGRVVLELETPGVDDNLLVSGVELELTEHGVCAVGIVRVSRLWREAVGIWYLSTYSAASGVWRA